MGGICTIPLTSKWCTLAQCFERNLECKCDHEEHKMQIPVITQSHDQTPDLHVVHSPRGRPRK